MPVVRVCTPKMQHRAIFGQRLHRDKGGPGGNGGPGHGQRDPEESRHATVTQRARGVHQVLRLADERRPRQQVDVRIQHQRHDTKIAPGTDAMSGKPVALPVPAEQVAQALTVLAPSS